MEICIQKVIFGVSDRIINLSDGIIYQIVVKSFP
jgi:hypothetical protein